MHHLPLPHHTSFWQPPQHISPPHTHHLFLKPYMYHQKFVVPSDLLHQGYWLCFRYGDGGEDGGWGVGNGLPDTFHKLSTKHLHFSDFVQHQDHRACYLWVEERWLVLLITYYYIIYYSMASYTLYSTRKKQRKIFYLLSCFIML